MGWIMLTRLHPSWLVIPGQKMHRRLSIATPCNENRAETHVSSRPVRHATSREEGLLSAASTAKHERGPLIAGDNQTHDHNRQQALRQAQA